MRNNKKNTISKGYRLKPSTHRMIKEVQLALNATQDMVMAMAIKLFRKTMLISKSKINK